MFKHACSGARVPTKSEPVLACRNYVGSVDSGNAVPRTAIVKVLLQNHDDDDDDQTHHHHHHHHHNNNNNSRIPRLVPHAFEIDPRKNDLLSSHEAGTCTAFLQTNRNFPDTTAFPSPMVKRLQTPRSLQLRCGCVGSDS